MNSRIARALRGKKIAHVRLNAFRAPGVNGKSEWHANPVIEFADGSSLAFDVVQCPEGPGLDLVFDAGAE